MQIITVIIPAASKATENQWMKDNIDRAGGEKSFMAALTSNGSTITHYWFSNQWPDEKAALLIEHFGSKACEGNPADALTDAGLTRYSKPL